MVITSDEFVQWKAQDTTKAFFQSVDYKREEIKEVLAASAGEDPVKDAVLRGYCLALADITKTSLEDVSEDTE